MNSYATNTLHIINVLDESNMVIEVDEIQLTYFLSQRFFIVDDTGKGVGYSILSQWNMVLLKASLVFLQKCDYE